MKVCKIALAMVAAPFLAVAASAEKDTHLDEAKAIFEWVSESRDGYITPKLELRRETLGDLSSPMGVYARKPSRSMKRL